MQIQPIVVGTAGHIDHGKSTLVKALTGIDPDRLKEEIERGMTIDLGFARFQLPDGRTVGIVDVPGHERFVKNMVAGATGIDVVILVVAADDGVMPQTREHLAIMSLLGIRRGLVALTKIDAVAADMVELAREDVRAATRGTFLEDAPILPLSSITGAGLDEFKSALHRLVSVVPPRDAASLFRMPIQRVFSAHGFGTVVTGIPMSGSARVGDVLEVHPGAKSVKVRGLQAYSSPVGEIQAGHSSALNLADVDVEDVRRGMVVATPGFFRAATMLGARMTSIATLERPIEDRTEIRLHTGTSEVLGELVLLDCESLAPGETALVQLRLHEPVVCAPGDRFVARLASPAWTLGGGVILEESKHRLKRFKRFVVEELTRTANGLESPREALLVTLSRAQGGASTAAELAIEIKRSKPDTDRYLNDLKGQGRAVPLGSPPRWIHAERLARCLASVEAEIGRWFEAHPNREALDVRDLRRAVSYDADFLAALLQELARGGTLALEAGGVIRPKAQARAADGALDALARSVVERLGAARHQPPSPAELAVALARPAREVQAVLELLLDRGDVIAIVRGEIYLTRALHEEARAAIVENCTAHRSLDIPSLRDRLQTTRKFLIPLLEHFDVSGLTIRQGQNRVLKRRG